MIRSCFGDKLDIHMGGIDLIFPHHENEIAQSQSLTQKPLARYWLHNGLIEVGKEKMSKSIGNILRTQEFIDLYGAETFRLLVLQQHYRSPMDLSKESILRAEALVERLYHAKAQTELHSSAASIELPKELFDLKSKIDECLFDDFNTAKALGLILSALRICYRDQKPEFWNAWKISLPILNAVFGILEKPSSTALAELRARKLKRAGISEARSQEIEARLLERENFRKQKNFSESDRVRNELEKDGIIIMDGPDGTAWSAG
jgi:cysteinyl-tRNA synthetase